MTAEASSSMTATHGNKKVDADRCSINDTVLAPRATVDTAAGSNVRMTLGVAGGNFMVDVRFPLLPGANVQCCGEEMNIVIYTLTLILGDEEDLHFVPFRLPNRLFYAQDFSMTPMTVLFST